jgi:hypothetical protein
MNYLKGEGEMRRKHVFTILSAFIFVVLCVGMSHALVGIEVDPPTQTVNSPVNITVVVTVGDGCQSGMGCNVLTNFGDGGSWVNLGRCEVSSGACIIRTTHTYGSSGTYTIKAMSAKCPANIGPSVSANVSILPPSRPLKPQPRKRPGY